MLNYGEKVIEFKMNGVGDFGHYVEISTPIWTGIKHRISQRNSNSFRSIALATGTKGRNSYAFPSWLVPFFLARVLSS